MVFLAHELYTMNILDSLWIRYLLAIISFLHRALYKFQTKQYKHTYMKWNEKQSNLFKRKIVSNVSIFHYTQPKCFGWFFCLSSILRLNSALMIVLLIFFLHVHYLVFRYYCLMMNKRKKTHTWHEIYIIYILTIL